MPDQLVCRTCIAFYTKIREPLARAAEELADVSNWSKGNLIKSYMQGYHESGHDEDYALKGDNDDH